MKLNNTFKNVIVEATWLLYLLLFVYAAMNKGLDFEKFQVELGQSPLLSAFAEWISWTVLIIEFAIVLFLLFPKTRIKALYAGFCLMCMFTAYIFIMLNYSSFLPCSCGGILEKMTWQQHLVFNVFFVIIAGLSLWFHHANTQFQKKKSTWFSPLHLLFSLVASTAFVIVLFLCSEEIMHHQNPFIRRYPQHPIMLGKNVDLKFNSYYFAGSSTDRIYLGNYTDPLHVTVFDARLQNKQVFKISAIPQEIQFKRIKILVRGSYFYLMDGTVPCIFWGRTSDWKITNEIQGSHHFTSAEPVDTLSAILRSNNGRNAAHIFSSLKADRMPRILYNDTLLSQQIDGVFDTDGMLAYNEKMRSMIYLYYYRNEFIVADNNANLLSRGHTIDTISRARIKVAYLKDNTQRVMAAPPLTVNSMLAVNGNLLFINSKIPGKYEKEKLWKNAAIIDVYDLIKNTYLLSFAIYNFNEHELQSFIVTDNYLFTLMGNQLVVYNLTERLRKEIKVLK